MENAQVADLLDEIADLLELTGADQFRIRAYRSAAQTVRGLPGRLEDMASNGVDPAKLPHIGKSTVEKIAEILDKGTCQRLLELQKKIPAGLTALMKVPQLGPRRAKLLYDKLRIKSIEELKAACAGSERSALWERRRSSTSCVDSPRWRRERDGCC
jgi:DNA polymerase (family X)